MNKDPLWRRFRDWCLSLPPWLFVVGLFAGFGGAVMLLVEGGFFLRDRLGEPQPEIKETHTVLRIGSSYSHTAPSIHTDPMWSYVRTRDENGLEFNIGISKEEIWNCEVGQPIVVIRQGLSAGLTPDGCKRKIAGEL